MSIRRHSVLFDDSRKPLLELKLRLENERLVREFVQLRCLQFRAILAQEFDHLNEALHFDPRGYSRSWELESREVHKNWSGLKEPRTYLSSDRPVKARVFAHSLKLNSPICPAIDTSRGKKLLPLSHRTIDLHVSPP